MQSHGKMENVCKCCGAVLENPIILKRLTALERQVYQYIAKHPGCSRQNLYTHLYHDRSDGGPEPNIISAVIWKINRHLASINQAIKSDRRSWYATYRLLNLNKDLQ